MYARDDAVAAVVADDAGTMGLEFVHMWHDWAGVAGAGHEGVERALMWGIMMAGSEKRWERRAGRKSQQNLEGLNLP